MFERVSSAPKALMIFYEPCEASMMISDWSTEKLFVWQKICHLESHTIAYRHIFLSTNRELGHGQFIILSIIVD